MQRSLIQMTEVALPYKDAPSVSVVPSIAAVFAAVNSFRVVPTPVEEHCYSDLPDLDSSGKSRRTL